MKKDKKIDKTKLLGITLMLIGLSLIIYEYTSTYLEKRSIDKEMQAFFDAPMLTNDDFEMPEEVLEKDLWKIEIDKINVDHPVIQSSN